MANWIFLIAACCQLLPLFASKCAVSAPSTNFEFALEYDFAHRNNSHLIEQKCQIESDIVGHTKNNGPVVRHQRLLPCVTTDSYSLVASVSPI